MAITKRHGLAPMQLGMLLDHARGGAPGTDIEQLVVEEPDALDADTLKRAWDMVVARHDVLRASFAWEDGQPALGVHEAVQLPFVVAPWPGQAEGGLEAWLLGDRERGFNVEAAPVHRVTVFTRPDGGSALVWTLHHILCDGRSILTVLAEVFEVYGALREGRTPALAPTVQLDAHVAAIDGRDRQRAQEHFRHYLAGWTAPTPLPLEGMPVPVDAALPRHLELARPLDGATARLLERVASDHGVTVHTLLQAAWAVLLGRHAGVTDVVFGGTRACRRSSVPDADRIVGCLINTLPVRANVAAGRTVAELWRDLRRDWVAMRPFEHTPLTEARAASELVGTAGLFRSFLVYERYSLPSALRGLGGAWAHRRIAQHEQTGLPLSLAAYASPEGIDLRLEVDRTCFTADDAARLLAQLEQALVRMAKDPAARLGALSILPAEEERLVCETFNRTERPFPEDATIHGLIAARAEVTPDAVAVVAEGERLTYRELLARAARVADALRDAGVAPGDHVGVCLLRGLELPVAILGVLRAGAAYVPLDPKYPAERVRFMIEDGGLRAVLTHGPAQSALPGGTFRAIDVGEVLSAMRTDVAGSRGSAGPAPCTADHRAYMIYTSGSTGVPKGTPILHRALVNHAFACIGAYDLVASDVVPQFASISFDIAVEEMFPTWVAGGTLLMRPEQLAPMPEFLDWVRAHGVTVLQLPTAFWHELTQAIAAGGLVVPPSVRAVVVGGERASAEIYRTWRAVVGNTVRWINSYGPTETTVTATTYEPTGEEPGEVPIGRPLQNLRAYVLDDALRPVPVGARGELCIAGVGVSPGYHARADRTREKFVRATVGGREERLYRTGDMARWLRNGVLDFLGRVDDQVKLRGFRIELAEIENALVTFPGVEQSAAAAREVGGAVELVGYFVPAEGTSIEPRALRAHLGERLPEFMVPAFLLSLPSLPKLPNGKVDRRGLPTPDAAQRGVEATVSAKPRNVVEMMLAELWKDVLGLPSVGMHDNFFELGGHSLQSIRVLDRANKLGLTLTPQQFFQSPTIAGLAEVMELRAEGRDGVVVTLQPRGERPPIYFLHSVPGDLLGYGNLVYHLGDAQPAFGFQSLGLSDPALAHRSIGEMAEYYADRLEAIQPKGSFTLAGWCFGGQVALAMARALRARGRTPSLLVLLECYPRGRTEWRRRTHGLAELVRRGPGAWARFVSARMTMPEHDEGDPELAFALSARTGVFAHRARVHDTNLEALAAHVDAAYAGPTLLIRGDEPPNRVREHDYGWRRVLPHIQVFRVQGDHEALMKEPFVAEVSAILKSHLPER